MKSGALAILLLAAGILPAAGGRPRDSHWISDDINPSIEMVRIATFNCSLNRATENELQRDLATPDDPQARAVAEIIQRVRPDILLLQEFDYDAGGKSLAEFQANYLGVSQNGQAPIRFEHSFFTESNTGIPSGFDLDHDGKIGGGGDALGFGAFPGQYAMVLLSRFPIDAAHARTFRKFLWRDMPGALLPDDPNTRRRKDWYSPEMLAVLPLSSKSHWDVPVQAGSRPLHLLISHPTPPAFDGPEDRNGHRNHDEIRFWNDYITAGKGKYIRDDNGVRGGFDVEANRFIIMGDQNSDPVDGASLHDAIEDLWSNRWVLTRFMPSSQGAVEAAAVQGGVNATQHGPPDLDTADFFDGSVGNLRVDYLLPRVGLTTCGSGVFWPKREDPGAALVWGDPPPSSDHRLVWGDFNVAGDLCPPGSDPKASDPSHPGR